jgi:hypothetical protein
VFSHVTIFMIEPPVLTDGTFITASTSSLAPLPRSLGRHHTTGRLPQWRAQRRRAAHRGSDSLGERSWTGCPPLSLVRLSPTDYSNRAPNSKCIICNIVDERSWTSCPPLSPVRLSPTDDSNRAPNSKCIICNIVEHQILLLPTTQMETENWSSSPP